MIDADRTLTEQPAESGEYPKPIRHLSVSDGSVLNLGRAHLCFMQTPGETAGSLSTMFIVYDDGYPHKAFIFGGAGMDFSGAEVAEMYLNSI